VLRLRFRSIVRILGRSLLALIVLILILIGIGISALETGWAKNEIRGLIVRQANQYLTAQLEIGRLEGSLFRGLQLGDIRLSRAGRTLVAIKDVELSYSLRELFQQGTVIKRIAITGLEVAAAKEANGRWDLANLVRREARQEEQTGPGRPIEIVSIDLKDATIALADPVSFGAAHIPTRYESLNGRFSFKYVPVHWTLTMRDVSWLGSAPNLTMKRLSGGIDNGPTAILFDNLMVETPRSQFTLAGRINREKETQPTTLDLKVNAARFAFQEWAGVLNGLRNIAVEANFDTTLLGPLTRLATDLRLQSTGGGIRGAFVLDTKVPGWHGEGAVTASRIDLARWMNKPDKPSDISGRVTFNLAFGFGEHFPRGSYRFEGPHAMFMGYAGDNVRARGELTADEALIAEATATAYGAEVRLVRGSIGITGPFPFRFPGTMARLDLRNIPATIPVPRVESLLAFEYDVVGRFSEPFITGRARFSPSEFLGARIGDGMIGTIDTSVKPLTYSGDGELDGVDLGRFGAGLDVAWMRDPRYAGAVSGRFQVEGAGTDRESLRIAGSGRLRRADLFSGRIADADVTFDISNGTLKTTFTGPFASIDPAVALAEERFKASATGSANIRLTVQDLLRRSPTAADYDIDGTLALESSTVRGVELAAAHVDGAFRNATATLRHIDATGPGFDVAGSGTISFSCPAGPPGVSGSSVPVDNARPEPFDSPPILSSSKDARFAQDRPVEGGAQGSLQACDSDLEYDVKRADLARLDGLTGGGVSGLLSTKGRLTGSIDRPRLRGDGAIAGLKAPDFEALTLAAQYDVTLPSRRWQDAEARADIRATFPKVFDRALQEASGTIAMAGERLTFDVRVAAAEGRNAAVAGAALLHTDRREIALPDLAITLGRTPWRLVAAATPPVVTWNDDGLSVSPMVFANGSGVNERVGVSGTWRRDGNGALRVTATHVSLDAIQSAFQAPAEYGGTLELDATIRGTRQKPTVAGRVEITDGRFRRMAYERLAGRVDYAGDDLDIDVRLDQAPGVWINAVGKVPLGFFDRELPERPIDVAITSSSIGLGLIEAVTAAVSNVSGQMTIDVKAVGTSRDPHIQGTVDIGAAAFLVTATGARYKNGRAVLKLSPERVNVDTFHLEDASGRPLEVRGSLATHELTVGDLEIDVMARGFEVVRNEFGRVDIDAMLQLRGRFEAPRVVGDLTINGGDVNVDVILERALFQPYATEPLSIENLDAVSALNPWSRLGLDISLHIPKNLRLVGQDVQVTQGTPIGLGDLNLRVGGDLYLYKDPGEPLSVTGSLDAISGWYQFQGRRFDIDERTSSINFRGDLNPEIYVQVTREITGVLTRVSVIGPMRSPELILASVPPLDPSDILSLIVFNTSANDLTVPQQQELAIRAGTIAAGFLATPLISAVQRTLGLDILEIDPTGERGQGPRVTIAEQLAPGLMARFTRQFGQEAIDEATVEYSLSRLLRIRATFSDAGSLSQRSPFRRIERAGVDLLLFFSF
jgi:autotransporter translocation and assembly factor TamB